MTIRTRLTLWYSVLLLSGLVLVAAWLYYEMAMEHPAVRRSLAAEGHTPAEEVIEILVYAGLPAVLLALVGGWFLMRRVLAPITHLTQAVERVNAANLDQPLPRPGTADELERLTDVFNAMTRRLHDSFQRIREFTLHASHELKTPLSLMRNELDAAIHEGTLSATERQRAVSLLEEVERLTHIVDSLGFLTKADAGLLSLEKMPMRFDELLRDAAEDAEVLAQPQRIQIQVETPAPVQVPGDRRRLRQLLLILTDNAIKYNHPGGTVRMQLHLESSRARFTISNTGPGIPAHLVPRVFDRFFRHQSTLTRDIEGCGLGLTIAQRIVLAHEGFLNVSSEPGKSTTVTVELPAFASTDPASGPITEAVVASSDRPTDGVTPSPQPILRNQV